jgi:hypothetical protein
MISQHEELTRSILALILHELLIFIAFINFSTYSIYSAEIDNEGTPKTAKDSKRGINRF